MEIIESSKELESLINQAKEENKKLVVDFYADWCGPCKMLKPVLEEYSTKHANDTMVYKINADQSQDILAQYGVMSLPTLIVFQNGAESKRSVGYAPLEKIEEIIK